MGLACLAVYSVLLHFLYFMTFVVDDSFIFFRYVRNWIDGHGLVFNPGEFVEGHSSPLFTAALCMLAWTGLDIEVAAKLLGGSALLICFVAALRGGTLSGLNAGEREIVLVFLGAATPLIFFAFTGMETALYSACLCTAFVLQLRANGAFNWPVALALLATALARPEGIMYIPVAALAHLATARNHARHVPVAQCAALAGACAFFLCLRFNYYGAWLPNTFHAKTTIAYTQALPHFLEIADSLGGIAGLAFMGAGMLRLYRLRQGSFLVLAGGYIAAAAAFQLWAGADWMLFGRFLAPTLPLLAIILAHGFVFFYQALTLHGCRPSPVLTCAAACFLVLWAQAGVFRADAFARDRALYPQLVMTSRELIPVGQWLRSEYDDATSIAILRMGAVAYHSGFPIIDLGGLTDPVIGRNMDDKQAVEGYIAEKKPDLLAKMIWSTQEALESSITTYGAQYQLVKSFPQGVVQFMGIYERSDRLASLPTP